MLDSWTISEYFCPGCGELGASYREDGDGDYYAGSPTVCLRCHTVAYLDDVQDSSVDEEIRLIKWLKGKSKTNVR